MKTTRIGSIVLRVNSPSGGSWEFSCIQVSMMMKLNDVPTLTASVPVGEPVAGSSQDNQADRLLGLVAEIQSSAATADGATLNRCEAYEQLDGDRTLIFKGYVVNCGVDCSSSNGIQLFATFMCMGKAAPLMASPVYGYMEVNVGTLVERLTGDLVISLAAARASNLSEMAGGLGLDEIAETLEGVDIVGKVAKAVSAVRRLNMLYPLKDLKKESFGNSKDVLDAFGGNLSLNTDTKTSGLDNNCDHDYGEQLMQKMMHGMASGSVFSAIQSILVSYDYCLQLCPRWTCDKKDDFKIEITPCSAWSNNRTKVNLKASDVLGVNLSTDLSKCMTTPDVLFVTFQDACSLMAGSTEDLSGGIPMGVYARDRKLNEYLRKAISTKNQDRTVDQEMLSRCLEARAPQWLTIVNAREDATTAAEQGRNLQKDVRCESQPATLEDERVAAATAGKKSSVIAAKQLGADSVAGNVACIYAQALFQYLYRKESTCSVNLSPRIRFCKGGRSAPCLENHIGDTVEIDLSDAVDYVNGIKLLGVLAGLRVEYRAGDKSTLMYSATLERVRLSDADWIDKDCPIYTHGTGMTAEERDAAYREAQAAKEAEEEQQELEDYYGQRADAMANGG